MNFKLVSKNNLGVVLILLLIIILSQNRTLNFLIDTYLGRMFLIFLLLVVSYCNKILGVVFVFIIIISFNVKIGFFEGFENSNQEENTATNSAITQPSVASNSISKLTNESQVSSDSNTTPKITVAPQKLTQPPSDTQGDTQGDVQGDVQGEDGYTPNTSIEGFDMIGTENTIKRGKQSNSIPVHNFSRASKNVSPSESGSLFKDNYSKF